MPDKKKEIEKAAAIIRHGGVVAFPTETYYGLAVDPFNLDALEKLFRLKNRPEKKPVLLLIADISQLNLLVTGIPSVFRFLLNLWPAPLTLVFEALPDLSPRLTAGVGTVGVRISPHPIADALVRRAGRPITATSANLSGEKPATEPSAVEKAFGTGIDYLLDGGMTLGGASSTLVGCEADSLVLLREGVLPFERLKG